MKKRITGILFSFALMLAMMPALGMGMPAYADEYTVEYLDENGNPSYHAVNGFITDETTSLYDGWYAVESDGLSLDKLTISGDVNLILCDGSSLTVKNTASDGIAVDGSLTIYAQSTESAMGKLSAEGKNGISVNGGDIKIVGGDVTATAKESQHHGINAGGKVTIMGGKVTAAGTEGSGNGINAVGAVTITGGKVTATGDFFGIMSKDDITIDSGTVIAEGGFCISADNDININGGSVTAISVFCGIRAENNITVSGKLTAVGDMDSGIFVEKGGVTIRSGADLTATGGDAEGFDTVGIATNADNGVIIIEKGAKVSAAGGSKGAIDGIVKNAAPGLGWTNKEGTEGKTFFDINTQQGQELGANIKCAVFPAPEASVTKAPEANTLTYSGSAQELVTAGTASDGIMQYALSPNVSDAAPESGWSTSIPKGTKAGTYYVWYKAEGDAAHADSGPQGPVKVTIAEAPPAAVEYTITYDLNGGTLYGLTGTVTEKITAGTVITLPEPMRDGYSFDHWEGSRYDAGDEYLVNGDHTFRAIWKTADNGGSDSDGKGGSSGKGVKTGDENALGAWAVLLAAALAGTAGMVFARKKETRR